MYKVISCILLVVLIVQIRNTHASLCGCKETRKCYKDMVEALQDRDEESCIEDASIGVSTVMIFLKAIKQFCPDIITIYEETLTYEGRRLYEVILYSPAKDGQKNEPKQVIVVDAGQQAGTETVGMALFLMEQLVACQENNDMLKKVKWVILPSTNPDGMEYGRYNRVTWKKNVRPASDGLSYGVDISRNFEYQWDGACNTVDSGFSPDFPGPAANSENETMFIKDVLTRYKKEIKLYLSIRRDGHAILYPHAYSKVAAANNLHFIKVAADVAAKVNQRAGGVQLFMNDSIFVANAKAHCGHSVDFANDMGAPLAYEMRVFLGNDNRIMSRFQQLPRGYESSLRMGYLSGIRELYNAVVNDKKFHKVFKK